LAVTAGKSTGKQIAIPATSTLTASRRVLKPLAQQPRMDDSPLVASSRLKIQQWRARILEFKKELQRLSAGWPAGLTGMRLKPAVPFPNNQSSRVFLSHQHAL
jgi:hypothetical protein